jgi:hypothetical protein
MVKTERTVCERRRVDPSGPCGCHRSFSSEHGNLKATGKVIVNNLSSGPTKLCSRKGGTKLRFLHITLSSFQVTRHNLSEGNLSHLIALRFPQILLRLL